MPLVLFPEVSTSSEAIALQLAHIVSTQGEWILPLWGNQLPPYPPLAAWLAALLNIFPYPNRILSLLSASLLLALMVLMARVFLAESEQQTQSRAVFFSALFLCTSYGFVLMAGDASASMLSAFLVNAAFLSALMPYTSKRFPCSHWNWYALSAIFTVLSVLTSGVMPALVVLILFTASMYILEGWRIACREFIFLLLVFLLFSPLIHLWYFIAFKLGGQGFLLSQLGLSDLPSLIGFLRPFSNGSQYYFDVLLFLCPWVILLPFVVRSSVTFDVVLRRVGHRSPPEELKWRAALSVSSLVFAALLLLTGSRPELFLYIVPLFSLLFGSELAERTSALSQADRAFILPRASQWLALFLLNLGVLFLLLLSLAQGGASGINLPFEEFLVFLSDNSGLFLTLGILCVVLAALAVKTSSSVALLCVCFLVVAIPMYAYEGMRAKTYGFVIVAQQLDQQLSKDGYENEEFFVIRAGEPDELFDPILWYLNRNFRVVSPYQARLACDGVYLATQDWIDSIRAAEHLFVLLGRYSLGRRGDELVLFRCMQPLSAPII